MRHDALPVAVITATGLAGSLISTVVLGDNVVHAMAMMVARLVVSAAAVVGA